MPEPLTVDSLIRAFQPVLANLPDHRTGRNVTYTISDAVLSAFVAQALNPDSNDTIYFRDHAERLAKRLGQSWSQGLVRIL